MTRRDGQRRRILPRRCPRTSARGVIHPRSATPVGAHRATDHDRPRPADHHRSDRRPVVARGVVGDAARRPGAAVRAAPTVVDQHCERVERQQHRSSRDPRRNLDRRRHAFDFSSHRVDQYSGLGGDDQLDLPDPPPTTEGTQTSPLEASPVAVGVGDSLVVTTARAVEGRTSITLTDANGQAARRTVLMVDAHLGLASCRPMPRLRPRRYGIGPGGEPR